MKWNKKKTNQQTINRNEETKNPQKQQEERNIDFSVEQEDEEKEKERTWVEKETLLELIHILKWKYHRKHK